MIIYIYIGRKFILIDWPTFPWSSLEIILCYIRSLDSFEIICNSADYWIPTILDEKIVCQADEIDFSNSIMRQDYHFFVGTVDVSGCHSERFMKSLRSNVINLIFAKTCLDPVFNIHQMELTYVS